MSLETRLQRLEAKTAPPRKDDLSRLSDEELLERVREGDRKLLATIREAGPDAEWSPEDRDFLRRAVTRNVRAQLSEAELQSLGLPP